MPCLPCKAFDTTFHLKYEMKHRLNFKIKEFLKELDNNQYRITEIDQTADALLSEGHPEQEQIYQKREEVNREWHELGTLTATR